MLVRNVRSLYAHGWNAMNRLIYWMQLLVIGLFLRPCRSVRQYIPISVISRTTNAITKNRCEIGSCVMEIYSCFKSLVNCGSNIRSGKKLRLGSNFLLMSKVVIDLNKQDSYHSIHLSSKLTWSKPGYEIIALMLCHGLLFHVDEKFSFANRPNTSGPVTCHIIFMNWRIDWMCKITKMQWYNRHFITIKYSGMASTHSRRSCDVLVSGHPKIWPRRCPVTVGRTAGI